MTCCICMHSVIFENRQMKDAKCKYLTFQVNIRTYLPCRTIHILNNNQRHIFEASTLIEHNENHGGFLCTESKWLRLWKWFGPLGVCHGNTSHAFVLTTPRYHMGRRVMIELYIFLIDLCSTPVQGLSGSSTKTRIKMKKWLVINFMFIIEKSLCGCALRSKPKIIK